HWCPLGGPHHLLHVVPGKKPRLVRHAPEDYWYEQGGLTEPFWLGTFELAANPAPLLARLDWVRSYKDPYEVRSLEEATASGARGHRAAREAFAKGAS